LSKKLWGQRDHYGECSHSKTIFWEKAKTAKGWSPARTGPHAGGSKGLEKGEGKSITVSYRGSWLKNVQKLRKVAREHVARGVNAVDLEGVGGYSWRSEGNPQSRGFWFSDRKSKEIKVKIDRGAMLRPNGFEPCKEFLRRKATQKG